ncbi:MAG: marine proteobacterial sortase target protein, partial [Candidatus Marinimicrobia bacterium]|nr:marine proteobacterial sortase target protein [Candidatus Neomarinimicrobiota bacterium]
MPHRIKNRPIYFIILLFMGIALANPNDKKSISLKDIQTGTLVQKGEKPGQYYELPRLDTKVDLAIDGLVVSATVDQMFVNNSSEPIEAIYVFPLPDKAAVYDMVMIVNDRLIQSHVKERKAAKKTYEKAKKAGKRASLTEQERPNIFTNSVANILPNDTLIIRLNYVDYLDYSAGVFTLRFPMVVGPRYTPGEFSISRKGSGRVHDTEEVLDASRITPPVMKKTGNTISVNVSLNTGMSLDRVWSPTHAIEINNTGKGTRDISFDKGKEVPNRDFVLSYSLKNKDHPNTALFTSKMGDDNYFMLMTVPPAKGTKKVMPKEVIYILDISGSMGGASILQAKKALYQAIYNLNEGFGNKGDYFNIIVFNNNFKSLFDKPVAATQNTKKEAISFIFNLNAEGSTEALPALLFGMNQAGTSEGVPTIFFITDGDVGNETALIRNIHYSLGNTRLFSIGIGAVPNSYLLRKVSKYGRGTYTFINSVSEVESKIETLLEKVDNPILTDLAFEYEGNPDLYPNPIQDLYHDEPLILFGKVHQPSSREHATLKGNMSDGPVQVPLTLDWSHAASSPAIPTLWARSKISDLMDEYHLGDKSKKDEILDLAVNHHILTKFTSFVAVEQQIVNPLSELLTVAVPTDLPHGWVYDAVFGSPKSAPTATYASNGRSNNRFANMIKPVSYTANGSASLKSQP